MLRVYAEEYVEIGRLIQQAIYIYGFSEIHAESRREPMVLDDEMVGQLHAIIQKMLHQSKKINLAISTSLLDERKDDIPRTRREFELIANVINKELFNQKFYHVGEDRAKYQDLYLSQKIVSAFPLASKELVSAGNAFCCRSCNRVCIPFNASSRDRHARHGQRTGRVVS